MAFRSWLTSSLVRVYPATPPARVSLPSLEAARNEAFSFQLALRSDSRLWDIGAGSGSVGLEASRIAHDGHVWAMEKNAGDAANARANARRLRASNYSLFEGRAPAGLDEWPDPDAVFIGGSGGELAELIALVLLRLKPGGLLVMNFVTLENLATAIPGVYLAACIAGQHERWGERPILVIEPREGAALTEAEVLSALDGKIAKWWMPDAVIFIDKMPLTATGKLSKLELRNRFGTHLLGQS